MGIQSILIFTSLIWDINKIMKKFPIHFSLHMRIYGQIIDIITERFHTGSWYIQTLNVSLVSLHIHFSVATTFSRFRVTLTHTEFYDFHEVFLKYTTLIKVHLKLQPVLYLSLVFGIFYGFFKGLKYSNMLVVQINY